MAKTRNRMKGPENGGLDATALSNLSEEERAQYLKATGQNQRITASEGTVSQKTHEDAVKELKEKISTLDTKLTEAKEDLTAVRGERDEYKGRFEKKLEEIKTLTDDNDELKSRNRELSDKVQDLEGKLKKRAEETEVVRDDAEIERLSKEVDGLKAKLKSKEDECETLESEKASLISEKEGLEREIRNLRESGTEAVDVDTAAETKPQPEEKVRRTSPTTFESELFTDQKYLVRLARSGRTISFTPDVEGAAICVDKTISLPKLADLVPFRGETEYDTVVRDGSEIVVVLV